MVDQLNQDAVDVVKADAEAAELRKQGVAAEVKMTEAGAKVVILSQKELSSKLETLQSEQKILVDREQKNLKATKDLEKLELVVELADNVRDDKTREKLISYMEELESEMETPAKDEEEKRLISGMESQIIKTMATQISLSR